MSENNGIGLYFKQIEKFPLLTAEEEYEIAMIIMADGPDAVKAREKMINSNLRLVIKPARKWAYMFKADFMEVIQMGNIGLMKAVKGYDPTKINPTNGKHYRFSTYALNWVIESIRRDLMNTANTIRIPIHAQRIVQVANRLQREHEKETGQIYSMDELYEHTVKELENSTGFNRKSFDHAMSGSTAVVSDQIISPEDGQMESIYERTPDNVDYLEQQDTIKTLEAFENGILNEREMYILSCRCGLDPDLGPQTLEETGALVGIKYGRALTRERIRQIEKSSLQKLRRYVAGTMELNALNKQNAAKPLANPKTNFRMRACV